MWDGKDPGLLNEQKQTTRQEAAEALEADRAAVIVELRQRNYYLRKWIIEKSDVRFCIALDTIVALALNAGADFGVRPGEVLR